MCSALRAVPGSPRPSNKIQPFVPWEVGVLCNLLFLLRSGHRFLRADIETRLGANGRVTVMSVAAGSTVDHRFTKMSAVIHARQLALRWQHAAVKKAVRQWTTAWFPHCAIFLRGSNKDAFVVSKK